MNRPNFLRIQTNDDSLYFSDAVARRFGVPIGVVCIGGERMSAPPTTGGCDTSADDYRFYVAPIYYNNKGGRR